MLLVHGQPGDRADWAGVVERLRSRFRLLVPDRPGYGASPGPALGPRQNAAQLAALVEESAPGPVGAVGHSYGAAVALWLAHDHPEVVSDLVLVCPAASPGAIGAADRLLALPAVGEAVGLSTMRSASQLAHLASRLRPGRPTPPGRDRTTLPSQRLGPFADSWRHDDAWRSFAVEQRALVAGMADLWAAVPGVAQPVTVLAGRRDRVIPAGAVEELAGALPRCQVVWSDRGGHLLPWRRPWLVAETVVAALEEPSAG